MLFGLGAVLQHSHTPSLRVTGFEDDDEDENENEALSPVRVAKRRSVRS